MEPEPKEADKEAGAQAPDQGVATSGKGGRQVKGQVVAVGAGWGAGSL